MQSRTRRERRRRTRGSKAGDRGAGRGYGEALERFPLWVVLGAYGAATLVLFQEFILSDAMLYGSDTLALGYMARGFFADALATTGFPLWNPFILGGTPFLESLAGGDSLHPLSVFLLMTMETHRALGWKLVIHVFLAGVFMYAWLRGLGVSRGGAFVGGLAYLLAPYMITLVFPGHDGKIFVTAMTPLLFWSAERFVRGGGGLPLAALAGVIALVIASSHFQMAYFLFGAVGAYMLLRCVQISRGADGWRVGAQRYAAFLAFSILGAGVMAVQLVPAVTYVTEHSRRTVTTVDSDPAVALAYSSSWSLHPEELVSLAVPEFIGNNARTRPWTADTYWGRNGRKWNHEYLGLVALVLAGLAMTGGPRRGIRWFLVGMAGVALFFALGRHTPVWRLFYEFAPGVSLFRAPSMAVFLTGFGVATLAAMGVDRLAVLIDGGAGRRAVRLALGAAAALLAVGWLLAASGVLLSMWTGLIYPSIEDSQRAALVALHPHLVRGFGISTILVALLGGIWWGAARGVVRPMWLAPLLAALVAVDQGRVNAAFIETIDYSAFAALDDNLRFLLDRRAEEEPFRVLSLEHAAQDVRPGMHGLELAAGHHPNDLARYRVLIGMEGSQMPRHLAAFHPNVLEILNVKYLLWPEAQFGSLERYIPNPQDGWHPLAQHDPVSRVVLPDGRTLSAVYRLHTLPRARVVGEALVRPEEQVMPTILDVEGFDPTTQTVLTEETPFPLDGPEVVGSVRWVTRTPNRLVFDVEASGDALVVLSENWFPAWRASVGGEEASVLRADLSLRAVPIRAGVHRVEMWYDASTIRAGFGISLLSLLILAAALGGDRVAAMRRNGRSAPE